MLKRFALIACLITLTPVSDAAAGARDNLQVFRDISNQVTGYTQFTIFDDVAASVTDGEVRLTGSVTMPYKKADIERRVARVEGVTSVRNDIEVLPVSHWDDELRFRIARAIYGNSSFWHYASMARPPIHVVVRNGRVTLTGVVLNDVERMMAGSLAAGFGALAFTNELQTDAEVQRALEAL